MKKIFLLLFILICGFVNAQKPDGYLYQGIYSNMKAYYPDSGLHAPVYSITPYRRPGVSTRSGQIGIDTVTHRLYIYSDAWIRMVSMLDTVSIIATKSDIVAAAGEVPLTFSTGLTRTVNTITVNTSQNIATLSNLTSNGIIKTSGGVGTLGIAVAGDFPTLNQNTTGSAATWTTGRTLGITGDLVWTSPSFDGSANVTAAGTIQPGTVTLAKMADMATASLIYRKTAGTGVPEVNTLATLKTDLGLTGTNLGDVSLAGETYISIAGQVITAADVNLATHVTGNLPVTNLNSGTGAGAGTYWSGAGTWTTPPGSGTVNSGTQYRLAHYATTGTAVSEAAAITAARALISDANGVPTHSAVTSTELGYVSGVTSAIQTQINAKGNVSNTGTPLDNQIAVFTAANVVEGTADFKWDGTIFNVGNTTSTSTATPVTLNLGNTYANTAGDASKAKIKLFESAPSIYAIGVSNQSVEFFTPTNSNFKFYVAGSDIATIDANGVSVTTGEAYDATGWNGDNGLATKNDVRDKFESLGGGVTSLSIASANGFAGSSSGGATPIVTLTTTITGILKGNGTAISAATSGTDYSAGTSALATGILKSTTTTGALTIAVAGDFPTLNQNTTGSAATLTTGRTISITGDLAYTSPSFNGSGNVTAAGTLATVNSNVGSYTNANITVNAKGLITAASNGTAGVTSFTDGSGFDGTVTGSALSLTTTLTNQHIPYSNSGALAGSTNLKWDNTNSALLLNGTSYSSGKGKLQSAGAMRLSGSSFGGDNSPTLYFNNTTAAQEWAFNVSDGGIWQVYDVTNGNATVFTLSVGGNASFVGDLTVADEAYAGGWNGSLEVPTKNAIYDKIQTIGVTPAALTKTDDTNVTLTLGGTPSTALLQASSITVGWTGDLAFSRITQLASQRLAGNSTGGAADIQEISLGSGLGWSGTSIVNTGIITEVDGSITNELQTIANTSAATTHTVTLSNSGGSVQLVEGSGITLTTTGTGLNGIVTIASTGGGLTINSTAITSGTAGRLLFENASNQVSQSANLFYDITNTSLLIAGATYSSGKGEIQVAGSMRLSGTSYTGDGSPTVFLNNTNANHEFGFNVSDAGAFQIYDITAGTASRFWIDGSTGNIGMYSIIAPSARLHLPAGTTGEVPFKIDAGTAATTPEDGAFEFHSSHLYFTIGGVRYQLDQQTSMTEEQVQDFVGNMINDGTLVYVDATPTLRRAAIAGDVVIAAGSNTSVIQANAVVTSMINALAVTNAKINDVAWSKVTGTPTTLAGYGITDGGTMTEEQIEDYVGSMIDDGTLVYGDGTNSLRRAAITGDVSVPAGDNVSVIQANAVDGTNIAMGSDAQGDVIYYNGTDYVRLGSGTAGQVLTSGGAAANVSWGTNGYTTIYNESSSLTQRSSFNLLGYGVNAVDNAGTSRTDVTIKGFNEEDEVASIQTSDATVTTLATVTIPNSTSGIITFRVHAGHADDASAYTTILEVGFHKSNGGTLTLGSVTDSKVAEYIGAGLSTANAVLGASSNNIRIRVTGEAGESITWNCYYYLTYVAPAN